MPNLGDLVTQWSAMSGAAFAVRLIVRDVLRYKVQRELLRLTSERQKATAKRKRARRRKKR